MAEFKAHVDLLRLFLRQREEIVERIEGVLNARRQPVRHFDDCFGADQARLRAQLEEAHWAEGFRPRAVHDLNNDLIDPAEMMIRAFYCWQQTRGPGRNGRVHYAHTLFNLYVLRWLQFLSMRVFFDHGPSDDGRSAGLAEIQSVLDELWRSSPAGQPAFVRDARWLIPLAQSLITDELAPYFEAARKVTETLPEADVLEIQKAHVRMLGAHLNSQIRYYSTNDAVPIDDRSVVLRTRTSNALDFALLVHGLVGLLKAYEWALQNSDERVRIEMAGAIWQGVSADPELFLNRIELLGAYSMIEHVFIAADGDGRVDYSELGRRHVGLLEEYGRLMDRWIEPLREDLPRFRPKVGGYSPYGLVFGLPTHLIEHMALKAIEHDAESRYSLEDLFDNGDARAAKLAWVNGWRKLPHIDRKVQRLYQYPQRFAEEIYVRIERELGRCARARTGKLYFGSAENLNVPELPARYFVSEGQIEAGRREAHYLVSYESPRGWIAIKKELLTEVLGEGRDARVTGLPIDAAQVLRLVCGGLVSDDNYYPRDLG